MKVYLFYLHSVPDKLNDTEYPGIEGLEIIHCENENHVLYAWTSNKEIRNNFKELRDMKKFIEIIKNIPKDYFESFANQNSDTLLENRCVTTKIIDSDKIIRRTTSVINSTSKEMDYVTFDSDTIISDLFDDNQNLSILLNSDIFINQYKNVLDNFKLDEMELYLSPYEESGLPFHPLVIDSLSVYSHLYKNTYKKG